MTNKSELKLLNKNIKSLLSEMNKPNWYKTFICQPKLVNNSLTKRIWLTTWRFDFLFKSFSSEKLLKLLKFFWCILRISIIRFSSFHGESVNLFHWDTYATASYKHAHALLRVREIFFALRSCLRCNKHVLFGILWQSSVSQTF